MAYLLDVPSLNNIETQKFVHDTSAERTLSNTSVDDIDGSEISYTCASSASNIIYECTLHLWASPDVNNTYNIELYEDAGSGYPSSGLGDYYRVYASATRLLYRTLLNIRFVLPTYTGSRSYKLRVRSNGTGSEASITKRDGTTTTDIYVPVVQMYSII